MAPQLIEKAQTAKEIQGNPSLFLFCSDLGGFCWIWINLDSAWKTRAAATKIQLFNQKR